MLRRAIPCLLLGGLLSAAQAGEPVTFPGSADSPLASKLFRHQYSLRDPDFCGAQVCVDFDNDGRRELLFASRATGNLQLLNAADGKLKWSKTLKGKQQSTSAFDVDGDGRFEILYSVSNPGLLYLLDADGKLRGTYDSGDNKLGNSAVILDADGDGLLDGFFGSRSRYLIRLNMRFLTQVSKRTGWSQCGCYTSAMDVDRDGRWDLFAGTGDDSGAKGVLHRFDPVTLKSTWSFFTNDNASSADAVLVDIDGDGQVEIIKSVDNYKGDDAHDAVFALETDGTLLWKVPGLSGEDSPNVADLDGDGEVEIVGMTFGGEVWCLDPHGQFKWRVDLRPELDNSAHSYMAPILCDLNGDRDLEILAMTNGSYAAATKPQTGSPKAVLFALNAKGEILDRLELPEPRYWGHGFVCNIDDDPFLELVISGTGGLDVIETRGWGPNTEHFQRRRSYQRLSVLPWAYEDSYFLYRGNKENVATATDNLVLRKTGNRFVPTGQYTTEPLKPPPGCRFTRLDYTARTPADTTLSAKILNAAGQPLHADARPGMRLNISEPVRLVFEFHSADGKQTPVLDDYSLAFDRTAK